MIIVIILVMSLSPVVDVWQRHMSRPLAVGLLFSLILGVITVVVSLIIPPLVNQVSELANNLPRYSHIFQDRLSELAITSPDASNAIQRAFQGFSQQLSQLSGQLLQATLGVVGGFFTFLTVIVLSIYLLLEEKGIRNFLVSVLPIAEKELVVNAINKIGTKLGGWLRSQLILMVTIGVITSIWASVLGLPYALTLGLWAGLTEVIPFLGPVLGGIPIIIIAFLDAPLKAVIALIIIGLVQQVESNFIVPKLMQRSVGLSPVVVIIALLIGGKLFGIPGTILSVPVAAAVSVVIQEWPRLAKAWHVQHHKGQIEKKATV